MNRVEAYYTYISGGVLIIKDEKIECATDYNCMICLLSKKINGSALANVCGATLKEAKELVPELFV